MTVETINQTAERYVSAFMGDGASATVYRERLVELAQNLIREGVNRADRTQRGRDGWSGSVRTYPDMYYQPDRRQEGQD